MPQQAWNNKRERQYEHVKEGEKERGRSTGRAKEIAARTVNKQRTRTGETASSPRAGSGGSRRSASRSNEPPQRSKEQPRSKEQLYAEAKRRNLEGRSKMTKAELERALR